MNFIERKTHCKEINIMDIFSGYFYRPQQSCEGYVFTPVCHSVHRGGVCLNACWDTTPTGSTPPGKHPPGSTPLGSTHPPVGTPAERWLPLRTIRILLECILVRLYFCFFSFFSHFEHESSDVFGSTDVHSFDCLIMSRIDRLRVCLCVNTYPTKYIC